MEFIKLQTFDNYIEANLVLNRYLNEGIDCYLKDETSSTLFPSFAAAFGNIKLYVREDFIEQANIVTSQLFKEKKDFQVCPNCSSTNVEYVNQPNNPANWLYAIVGYFFASYALKGQQVYKCYDCKKEFETLKNKNLEE